MYTESLLLLACCLVSGSLARPSSVILAYQDSLGQYSFGYSAPGSARSEIRTLDGNTHGAYSYIDGSGAIQTAQYSADSENGFRVVASNLPLAPLPVVDTPEVTAAREAHLQAVQMAERRDEKMDEKNQEENTSEAQSRNANVETQSEEKAEEGNAKEESKAVTAEIVQERSAEILETAESNKNDAPKSDNVADSSDGLKKDDQVIDSRGAKASVVPIYTVQVLPQDPSQDTVYTLPLHGVSEITRQAASSNIDQAQSSQESSPLLTPAGTTLNNLPLVASKIAPTEAPSTPAPEKQPEPEEQPEQPQLIALPAHPGNPLYYIHYVYV